MTSSRVFHDVTTIGRGQLVSLFQTIGPPNAYYDEQQDSVLAAAAPMGGKAYLQSLFARTNERLAQDVSAASLEDSGSTAAVAHVSPEDIITTANLGDSRATLFVCDDATGEIKSFPLTEDHAPTVPGEQQRIETAGGKVARGRMHGGKSAMALAVSRAFGDQNFEPVISHEPEIRTFDLRDARFGITPGHSVYLAVDTDGAHKKVEPEHRAQALAAALGGNNGLAQVPADLAQLAMNSGSRDNISVVFARLEPGRTQPMILAAFDGHGARGQEVSQNVSRIMNELIAADVANPPPPEPVADPNASTWSWSGLRRRIFGS